MLVIVFIQIQKVIWISEATFFSSAWLMYVESSTFLMFKLYMARDVYRLDKSIQHVFNASLLNLSSSRLKIRLFSFQILYFDGLQK